MAAINEKGLLGKFLVAGPLHQGKAIYCHVEYSGRYRYRFGGSCAEKYGTFYTYVFHGTNAGGQW